LQVFGDYSFDEANRELRRGADPVKIDPQQFDLLALFLKNPGLLLSREQITARVWGGRVVAESVLSVAIAKLRKTLGRTSENRDYIENRYGRGYRLLSEVKQVPRPARRSDSVQLAIDAVTGELLVGRADAFQQLRSSAEHAQTGFGRLCLVTGEPGIGKTRLAECFDQFVRSQESMSVLWGRCQSEASTPLWPVRQILRELIKQDLIERSPIDTGELERTENDGSLEAASERLFEPLKSAASIGHATLDLLAQSILGASRRRPLLLVVDDIQWADSASLRVLAYIADEITRSQILLVCCMRHSAAVPNAQREASRLWNHRNCQRIELQRLNVQEVTAYVQARLLQSGQSSHDRTELSRVLFARSEGNPFFLVDLLRALDPAQLESPELLNPSSLALDAVRDRLQDLPADIRRVLSAAAVIGHDFDIGILSHVTESRPEEVLDALTSPPSNHTIVAKPGVVGAYRFDHELIREVLYSELPPHERGPMHLRIGEGLLRRRNNGGAATNAELAHHFLAAQPYGDIDAAIAYAQTAAAEASRLAAHADVRDLLQRALGVLHFRVAPRPEIRAALLLQLALVERVQGNPAYGEHMATAVAIAREHRLGRLLTFAGQLLSVSPDLVAHAGAAAVLEAAIEALDADDYENLAIVHAHLAWTPPNFHSAQRVDALLTQAELFANKASSATARAAVDEAQLFFRGGPDTLDQAEQIAQRIEEACVLHPETATQARRILVARFRLVTATQRGDRSAMTRAIAVRTDLLSKLRNAEVSWHHERMLLVIAMNKGAFLQVKPDLIALRERARRLELHASALLWSLDYGVFLCRTSDVSSLASRVRSSLKRLEHDSPQIWGGKIRSMVEFGLHAEAKTAITDMSIAAIEDLPRDRDYLAALCHLAVGAAAVGSRAHCDVLLRLLSPYPAFYAVSASFHCEGAVASHLGLLCEAVGQLDRARDHYAHGIEREREFGLMPCAASTGYRLARLLLRDSDHQYQGQGMKLLEHVRVEAERMGMEPLACSVRELALRTNPSDCAAQATTQPEQLPHIQQLITGDH
jgi:DNA-binding winged helix-turn-helix (wHTH) protein